MEDLFGINAHRQAVQENIEKAFDLGFDADNNIEGIEKAKHQVGDIHPNGRWVWTEWAPGKFDWKSLKGKHHKGNQQTTTQSTSNKKQDSIEIGKIYVGKFDGDTVEYEVKEKRGGGYQLISYTYGKDEDEHGNPKKYTDVQEVTKTLEDMVKKIKEEKYFDLNDTASNGGNKEVASFMDKIKTFNNKYNDPSKVSVSKTPKGNWNVRYDGHRLGIIDASALSEETANKQGWNEGSGEKFKQRWKNEHKDLSDETIQSYVDNSGDIKYKQDVVDAAKELLEERKKNKAKDEDVENKSAKLSAFVNKTLEDIKDYAYGNFDDDRLKKAEKVLAKNESFAKKFMSATFPAASGSALSPSEKEISISDDESIILSAYKTTDTTSRDPAYRGSTDYHYAVYHKVGDRKKLLYSDSYSRVFSARYGKTSSEIRHRCKINALAMYFHI